MKVIYKYSLDTFRTTLTLPEGSEVLDVAEQNGGPYMWVLQPTAGPLVNRSFVSVPTGAPFDDEGHTYIGSVHGVGGWMVFHFFEVSGK